MARRLEALPQESTINLDSRLFNPVYFPYLHRIFNYEAYYGSSGSGKSTFIGQKLAFQLTTLPGRNLVCLRKQKTDCIESCWAEIYNALKKFKLLRYWKIRENPDHRMINRVNGNEILFEGVDNIEDIKSIKFTNKTEEGQDLEGDSNLTDVWYEEANAETDKNVLNELDRRLRDPMIKCRLIVSFNPVSRTHFLYELVMHDWQMHGVDSLVLKTTYKDNKFLPKEYGEKLERFKYTDPYAYQVYALGNWGTMGKTVFPQNKIISRLNAIADNPVLSSPTRGEFVYDKDDNGIPVLDSFKFIRRSEGDITIYKMPESRHPYVFALDTAGEGSDKFAGQLCDNLTGEQVAVFHSASNPDICVWQAYGLAKMYNYALFCPESNFDSWPIKAFLLLDYPEMYIRQQNADRKHVRSEDKYGFLTTGANRQTILTECVSFVEDNIDLINDPATLNEMLTFTRQEKKMKGIWWGAEPGANDDLVMAYAIMLQARTQQAMEMVADKYTVEGHWLRAELEMAVDEGRIDRLAAQEYIRNNGLYGEPAEERHRIKQRRVSRYAR